MSTPQLPDPIRSVPAAPGTLDAVLAAARAKRLRRLQFVGGTGAAVLLATVLAVNLGGGAPTDSLGVTDGGDTAVVDSPPASLPQDNESAPGCAMQSDGAVSCGREDADPEPPTSPSAEPGHSGGADPGPGEPTPTPRPKPTTTYTPYPTPHPSDPGPEPQPTKPAEPTYSPRPQPTTTAEPSQDARGEMRRTYVEGTTQCKDGAEWCADALPTPAGRPLELTVRACRDADAGPGQLETGPPGADFEVYDGEGMVWRWSSGQAFPAVMMSLDVQPGDCLQWATTWQGVDDANHRLAAGRYDGVAYVTAEPVRAPMKFVITLS